MDSTAGTPSTVPTATRTATWVVTTKDRPWQEQAALPVTGPVGMPSVSIPLDAVRQTVDRLEDDALQPSDLILPMADATLEEVRALLTDEGLVPD